MKKRTPNRQYPRMARVNELLREVLAESLERIDDERLGGVTITDVRCDADLARANARVRKAIKASKLPGIEEGTSYGYPSMKAGGKFMMRVKDADTLARIRKYEGVADRILFDAPAAALPGGTGTRFDWSLLKDHRHTMDWGIAGGLTPANVAQAITETGAPLVDVSSGVESAPGVKDVDKIAAFLKAAGR